MKTKKFTVLVGGVEVNDYLLTEKDAKDLAFEYEVEGYDDVTIEEISLIRYANFKDGSCVNLIRL